MLLNQTHHTDLTGFQDSGNVPFIERLFSVGQLLPCYVLAVQNSRINLSINPKLINEHLTARDIKPKLVSGPCSAVDCEESGHPWCILMEGVCPKLQLSES